MFKMCTILWLLLGSTCQAAIVWRAGFESEDTGGQPSWQVLGAEQGCGTGASQPPCPVASGDFTQRAARSGTTGLEVTVTTKTTPAASWFVQINTPPQQLTRTSSHRLCLWMRTDHPSIAANKEITLDVMQFGTWTWIRSQPVSLTTAWQQICMQLVTMPTSTDPGFDRSSSSFYWGLQLGSAADRTTYFVDDFTLESEPNNLDLDPLASATQRIDANRKGALTIQWLDSKGAPLPPSSLASLSLTMVRHGFPFGVAIGEGEGANDEEKAWYLNTTFSSPVFNALVPGFRFKWPDYEPQRGSYKWAEELLKGPDYLGSAEQAGWVLTRGHALEWLTPDYGFKDHWSRQDGCGAYRTYLRERITRDVKLFRGRYHSYDVWNEILNVREFLDKCDLWKDTVKDAFRWAAAADPTAQLCINEYKLVEGGDRTEEMVQVVGQWLAEGVPVHCIGIQSHISPAEPLELIQYRLDLLATLGLPLYITEFDLITSWDSQANMPVYSGTEEEQAAQYKNLTTLYFSHPAVHGIIWWDWWDSSHWVRGGGLWRADKKPKRAYTMLQQLLGATWNSSITRQRPSLGPGGTFNFRGFYGLYAYTATLSDGRVLRGHLDFPHPQPHINDLPRAQTKVVTVPGLIKSTAAAPSPPPPPSPRPSKPPPPPPKRKPPPPPRKSG